MKQPNPITFIPIAILLITFFSFSAAAQDRPSQNRYESCVELTFTSPNDAIEEAREWYNEGGGIPARHCSALALVELGIYGDAAESLESLAEDVMLGTETEVSAESIRVANEMRSEFYTQAGNAWLLVDMADNAYLAFSAAMAILPDESPLLADLLIDRARSLAEISDYVAAITDLDNAARQSPSRGEIYIYRASAWRALEELDRAKEDIDDALLLLPGEPLALLERGTIRWLMGNDDSAEQDWLAVIAKDNTTPEALAAMENLKLLESDGGEETTGGE